MPNSEKTQVALVQMRCGASPGQNLTRGIEFIREAAKGGAEIVCLPELFRSQYFCQSEDHDNFSLAESIPGPSTDALTKLAREKSVVIVASLFEKRAAGVYHNTAVVIDADGNILGKYRKMHIPDDPSYYEKFYFIQPPSGGTRARRKNMAPLNFPPGRRCSAAMPSRMGALWQRQIVSATKRQPGAMASSFGDKVLSARPVGKFWHKDPSI